MKKILGALAATLIFAVSAYGQADLSVPPTFAVPTQANQAANKSYVDTSIESALSSVPTQAASDTSGDIATDQFVSLAWYHYAQLAGYVGLAQIPTVTYTVPNGSASVTLPGYMARVLNLLDLGVAQNAYSYADAQMTAGSNVLYSPSAIFTSANIGQAITVTGVGAEEPNSYLFQSLSGTIMGVTDSHHVTLSFNAVNAVPNYGIISSPLVSLGQDYLPGQWIQPQVTQDTGYATLVQAQETITDTTVVSAAVALGGSGVTGATGGADGADGTCYVIGTTGTLKNKKNVTAFQAQVTVVGGSMTGVVAITSGGDYVGNPNTPVSPDGNGNTTEPVIPYGNQGCTGLTGGTLTIHTGIKAGGYLPTIPGVYAALPSATVGTVTNGSGTGATLNLDPLDAPNPGDQTGGQFTYGTDDHDKLNAAIVLANQIAAQGIAVVLAMTPGECVSGGPSACTGYTGRSYVGPGSTNASLTPFAENVSLIGTSNKHNSFFMAPNYPGRLLTWDATNNHTGRPFAGTETSFSPLNHQGITVGNISFYGDRTPTNPQTALSFCGVGEYYGYAHDMDFWTIGGQAIQNGCGTGAEFRSAGLGESIIQNIKIFNSGMANSSGTSTADCFENAAFATNNHLYGGGDLFIDDVRIFGCYGTAFQIHASTGNQANNFWVDDLLVEGLAPNVGGLTADLVEVGDTNAAWAGQVFSVHFGEVTLIDPYQGGVGFDVVTPTGGKLPYSITVNDLMWGGGNQLGDGIHMMACASDCYIRTTNIPVFGNAVVTGPLSTLPVNVFRLDTMADMTRWQTVADPSNPAPVAIGAWVAGMLGTPQGGQAQPYGVPVWQPAQNGIAASGTSCANADGTALTAAINRVTTGSGNVILPVPSTTTFETIDVYNATSAPIIVCAPPGWSIPGSANGLTLSNTANYGHVIFKPTSTSFLSPSN